MIDDPAEVRLRIVYSRPSTFDDGKPCRAVCDAEHPDADQVTIKVNGNYREIVFHKATFTGTNDRGHYQREGDWPLEKDWVLTMLQAAFEQGRDVQRRITRDMFKEVMGL